MNTNEPLVFTSSNQNDMLSQGDFVTLLLAIILGWILVAVWTRFIDNLTFGTLHLNPDSSWHALVIAITLTAIFVVFVSLINEYELVPGGAESDIVSAEQFPPGISGFTAEVSGSGSLNIIPDQNVPVVDYKRMARQMQTWDEVDPNKFSLRSRMNNKNRK